MSQSPKLALTEEERKRLRELKIKLSEIASYSKEQLSTTLQVNIERARELIASAVFQQVPSIGPKLALNLIELGYYSLEELKNEQGAELVERLERLHDVWMDPCVEDVMRLAVYHANHPGSDKQWWDFTEERKAYRSQNGYPNNRPKRSWHEAGSR
ncbi:MAG: helix-hairpin-helix domain-containing protein [Candidatus Pristimantibacillus sp.]